jgi:hypothetical protein
MSRVFAKSANWIRGVVLAGVAGPVTKKSKGIPKKKGGPAIAGPPSFD